MSITGKTSNITSQLANQALLAKPPGLPPLPLLAAPAVAAEGTTANARTGSDRPGTSSCCCRAALTKRGASLQNWGWSARRNRKREWSLARSSRCARMGSSTRGTVQAQHLAVLQRGVLVSHCRKPQPQGPRHSNARRAAPQAPVLQHRHVGAQHARVNVLRHAARDNIGLAVHVFLLLQVIHNLHELLTRGVAVHVARSLQLPLNHCERRMRRHSSLQHINIWCRVWGMMA